MFARQIHNHESICADREIVLRTRWNNIIDRLDSNSLAGIEKMMTPHVKYKFNNVVSWLMIFCMVSTLFVIVYWIFYPVKVMEICETKIITPKVKAGEYLIYEFKYNKYMDIPGDIDRRLVNHITIPLVSHEGYRRAVGKNTTLVYVWIPKLVPPGRYKLHTTITYEINPLHTTRVSYDTPEFEVINAK